MNIGRHVLSPEKIGAAGGKFRRTLSQVMVGDCWLR